MRDPDREDMPFLEEIKFGEASKFIVGSFPSYVISPMNNSTDPGSYWVNVKITDNNLVSRSTLYAFRIIVEPETPAIYSKIINTTQPASHQKTMTVSDHRVKITSITSSGLVTVIFSEAINIPGNFSSIGPNILEIGVRPAPGTSL